MKTLILSLTSLSALLTSSLANDPQFDATFRDALYTEEVKGDAAAALDAYTKLVNELEARRDLHATALFRQSECYRKLGKKEEAAAGFQKVLLLYPDVARYQKGATEALLALGAAPSKPESPGPAANPSAKEDDKWEVDRQRIERLLAESPDLINSKEGNLLSQAIQDGDLRMVKYLLEKGATPNVHGLERQPLTMAVQLGHKAICELLIEQGAEVRNNPNALWAAVEANHLKIMQFLVEKGGIPDAGIPDAGSENPFGGEADGPRSHILMMSIERASAEAMAVLLAGKPKLNTHYFSFWTNSNISPLHLAVISGKPKIVELLIAAGADVNFSGGKDLSTGRPLMPPLYELLGLLHEPTIRNQLITLLLENGTDLNLRKAGGDTILHLCARNDVEFIKPIVEKALKIGVDIDAGDKHGATVLHLASSGPNLSFWLEKGAGINAQDLEGNTPLHVQQDATDLLLAAKADPSIKNKAGLTPLEELMKGNRTLTAAKALSLVRANAPGTRYALLFSDVLPDQRSFREMGNAFKETPHEFQTFIAEAAKNYFDQLREGRQKAVWFSSGVLSGRVMTHLSFMELLTEPKDNPGTILNAMRNYILPANLENSAMRNFDYTNIRIYRMKDGKEEVINVDLPELFSKKQSVADIPLQWGDVIDLGAGQISESDLAMLKIRLASSIQQPSNEKTSGTPASGPSPARPNGDLPIGTAVPDKKGFVRSPYAPDKGYVDVQDLPSGTKIQCPYTGKPFRTP